MNRAEGVTRTLAAALLAGLLASQSAAAQSAPPKTFFTRGDAIIGGAFLAASAGVSLFDPKIERNFRDTTYFHVREGRALDSVFTHINETTLTVGGLAVYAIAKLARQELVADVSFHMAESVAAASLTAQVIRGPLGRTRPLDAEHPFEDQYEFHFMRGFTHFSQRSFPSIHSSSGFAAASALVAEVHRRAPGATPFVAVPAYLAAATPGLSRMYLGQHWASDIFAGALLGTFYGWRIVDYSHTHPITRVDRTFLGRSQATQRGLGWNGPSIGWQITF